MFKSKNKYLRFAANAIIFLLVVFIIDQVLGRTLRHYYFTSTSGENYRTTYALDSTNADIIILGSSRASHHYVPKIIKDSLGLSCYNTGRDGNFLLFNFAVFKSIVKRYSPKVVILDLNPFELYEAANSYDGLSTLLPYYWDKPELRGIIELRSRVERYKMLSAVYPFNSKILAILKGNHGSDKDNNSNGYLQLTGSSVEKNKPGVEPLEKGEVDPNKLAAIVSMANECNQKNIRFIVVQSPKYLISRQEKEHELVNTLKKQCHFIYWDFSNEPVFRNNPAFFKDRLHLNDEGAGLFTKMVAVKIARSKIVNMDSKNVILKKKSLNRL